MKSALVTIKRSLARELRRRREAALWTQDKLAAELKTSQARIAHAESGEASIDRLIMALLIMGASRRDIARAIEGA